MITQCITAAVLFGAGDIVAQQAVEGKGKRHDVSGRRYVHVKTIFYPLRTRQFARTLRLTFYGGNGTLSWLYTIATQSL
jgi:protein Mpv17